MIGLEPEPASLRFGDHPDKRDVGERIVGIAATDIGVNARKPHLVAAFVLDEALRALLGRVNPGRLIPELG